MSDDDDELATAAPGVLVSPGVVDGLRSKAAYVEVLKTAFTTAFFAAFPSQSTILSAYSSARSFSKMSAAVRGLQRIMRLANSRSSVDILNPLAVRHRLTLLVT